MTSNNGSIKQQDPLNETIPGEIMPLAFSTELKTKRHSRKSLEKEKHDYSFTYPEDKQFKDDKNDTKSILNCGIRLLSKKEFEDYPPYLPADSPIIDTDDLPKNTTDISARYLVKHRLPDFLSDSYSVEPSFNEEKTPFREYNVGNPNFTDFSHFRRFSNSIEDSSSVISMGGSTSIKRNTKQKYPAIPESESPNNRGTYDALNNDNGDFDENNETVYMMHQIKSLDMDGTTVSGFDDILDDVTLDGSFNMTKLASNLQMSDKKKAEQKNSDASTELVIEDVILLSNKTSLLWIGVPIQISDIKSFTLNLKSASPQSVKIRIKKNNSCFFLTDQLGKDRAREITVQFEPRTTKKLYVTFHPTDSNYHNDVIVINVTHRKFKINLFGYAEPAMAELKGFVPVEDPNKTGREVMMKKYSKVLGQNTLSVSAFNSGARTAFVALFSTNSNVRFNPKMFLLIPKTRMDFDVTVTVTEDTKFVDFFMINVDEELRRAARINFSEMAEDDQFKVCNHIQIFNRLPEEKTIRQDDLPKYDFRPHLCRQINTNSRTCYLHFDQVSKLCSATSDILTNESASTIGMFSKSSMTARSHLSNIEQIYAKTLCPNSTESFVNNLSQTLSAVVILNDVNKFPATPITQSSYIGVLIRNNHQFAVEWSISEMVASYHDSLFEGQDSGRGLGATERSSIDHGSIYSLTSIPVYNVAATMTVMEKAGSLEPNEAVVVPVRFSPTSTGKIECRCRVKVYTMREEAVLERDLDFVGDGVRQDDDGEGGVCVAGQAVPGLTVAARVQEEVRLVDLTRDTAGVARTTVNVQLKNRSHRSMDLYASRPRPPFDLRTRTMHLVEKYNMLRVAVRPPAKGVYEDVLILVDQDGHSVAVHLLLHVK